MTKYRPDQVFTPSAPQLGVNFSKRDEEDRLRDFFGEHGSQILIWGDTGVGKTSLVLKTLNSRYNFVRFQCEAKSTFDEIVRFFVTSVAGAIPESRVVKTTDKRTKIGSPHVSFETGRDRIVENVFSEEEFSSSKFVETLGPEAWLLVLDDFEKIQDKETRARLAELSKALSDQAPYVEELKTSLRLVFVGIAESAGALLAGDKSTWGRVVSLEVPSLTGAQISAILSCGFELIEISCSDEIVSEFTDWADGYARYAHALGLEASRCAKTQKLDSIGEEMVPVSLKAAVERWKPQYDGILERATRATAGSARVHAKILYAMSKSKRRTFSTEDVLGLVREVDPNITRTSQIRNALSELTRKEKRGVVLRRPHGAVGMYKFTDSLLKVYARMYFECKSRSENGLQ